MEELCFPAIACNAIYENIYLLGKSIEDNGILDIFECVTDREQELLSRVP